MRPKDDCPTSGCTGLMLVETTRTKGEHRTRYLLCSAGCGHRAKQVIQVDDKGREMFSEVCPTSSTNFDKQQ